LVSILSETFQNKLSEQGTTMPSVEIFIWF
jgi:hypothetical protein